MVADYKSRTTPSTDYRWDLKDSRKFPQWSADIHRIVRQHTSAHFIGSARPSDEVRPLPRSEPKPVTRSDTGLEQQAQSAHPSQASQPAVWDSWNEVLFDVISASVALSESQLTTVAARFGRTYDGQGLYTWVFSHANMQSQSAQLRLRAQIEALVITPAASAADVDGVLETIENVWPKITAFDLSSPRPAVEFAISRFPQTFSRIHHVAAMQAIIETLAVAEARSPVESTLLTTSGDKEKKAIRFQFKFCDLKSCTATTVKKCYVCSDSDDVSVPGVSTYQKMLAKIYKTYRREHKLSCMKGKRIPEEWFQRAKKRFGKKTGDAASLPVAEEESKDDQSSHQSGMPIIEQVWVRKRIFGVTSNASNLRSWWLRNLEKSVKLTTLRMLQLPSRHHLLLYEDLLRRSTPRLKYQSLKQKRHYVSLCAPNTFSVNPWKIRPSLSNFSAQRI
ncbi:MAG: hypothetical protein SGPRY_014602 [Prymnesium sp.]